jgi:hypothetical protein
MRAERKPWPMKWIVLAIILFIPAYTYVNLRYRKLSRAYQPYAETMERGRAAGAGYARIVAEVQRPADPPPSSEGAPVSAAPAGLPAPLQPLFLFPPSLPAGVGALVAPASSAGGSPYAFQFRCTVPDTRWQLASAVLFVKDGTITIVPGCERLVSGLDARADSSPVRVVVPAGKLPPGRYRVILSAAGNSLAWPLVVH